MLRNAKPSTATADKLDPTVAGCAKRAFRWGYRRLVVVNLFAWRSTDPAGLLQTPDPVGPDNDEAILAACRDAQAVICAWGSPSPLIPARAAHVTRMLRESGVQLHYLKFSTKTGQPYHPLYVAHSITPTLWAA